MMRRDYISKRGVILVAALVLLAGMCVVIVALTHEVTLDFKMAENLSHADQALELAKVGIDTIIYLANTDSDWRTNHTSGVWLSAMPISGGTFTASGIDQDGDLADCPIDTVTATSVGTYDGTLRRLTATLTPPGHESMMFLAYAPSEIKIEGDCRAYGDLCSKQVVYGGGMPDHKGNIYAEKPDNIDDELKDADTDIHSYETAPALPTIDYDWFVARGSQISPPNVDGKYLIADKVISPDNNPYGFTNPNGIYYILGTSELRFVRCHITATIVVKAGVKVLFDKACVHAPAFPYYPALVMKDELSYNFDQNLSEDESDVDFNTDGDKSDVFTPSVTGIVYAKKKITGLQAGGGTNIVRFKGALVSDKIILLGTGSIFEQDPSLATNLVNQFQGNGLKLVTGSVRME